MTERELLLRELEYNKLKSEYFKALSAEEDAEKILWIKRGDTNICRYRLLHFTENLKVSEDDVKIVVDICKEIPYIKTSHDAADYFALEMQSFLEQVEKLYGKKDPFAKSYDECSCNCRNECNCNNL